jgi:hypothetical protein
MVPLLERVHPTKLLPVVAYEKLPLLWALARTGVSTATANIKHSFFMFSSSVTQISRLRGVSSWAANGGVFCRWRLLVKGTVL